MLKRFHHQHFRYYNLHPGQLLAPNFVLIQLQYYFTAENKWQPSFINWVECWFKAGSEVVSELLGLVVPVLVLTAFLFRDRQRSRLDPLWRSLPVLGIAVSLIGLRYYILGHMGGYHKRYLAYTRNNHNTIIEVDDTPYQVFFEAAWSYVCFPTGASGEQALLLGGAAGMVVALLVAAYYAWRALIAPLLPAADQNRRILLLLFLWICGHAVLYALTRNWFWRQSYPMLAPFALLVTMAARETWDSPRSLVWKGAHFLPQGVLLVSILHHSPALHGLNRQALKGQFKASEIIAYITEDLAGEPVQEPAIIYLAMPVRGPAIREALLWLRRESPGRHRRFLWLAVLRAASKDMSHEPVVDHVTTGERARLVLRGHGQWDTKLAKSMDITGKQMIRTDRLHVRGAHAYVYVTSGEREYALWKVTAPAADEEPLQRRRRGRKKGKAQDDIKYECKTHFLSNFPFFLE